MCVVTHEDRYLVISFFCDVPGSMGSGLTAVGALKVRPFPFGGGGFVVQIYAK